MVRYVFNCWRARDEVLLVRQQFYGDADDDGGPGGAGPGGEGHGGAGHDSAPSDGRRDSSAAAAAALGPRRQHRQRRRQLRQQAVARVSMWMARQHCSHMVESTALLTAAVLGDEAAADNGHGDGWATYAVRATYAAAFSRFVTGLIDGHQDKLRKQSMYSVAKKIRLPAAFVELRHQATHEQLPARAKLRSMAHKALAWIWHYYWKDLAVDASRTPAEGLCREAVLAYLRGDDDDARRHKALRELGRWDVDLVLGTIADLQQALPGNQVYIKCLKLSKELMVARAATRPSGGAGAPEQSAATAAAQEPVPEPEGAEPSSGWTLLEGPWKPKPIGLV